MGLVILTPKTDINISGWRLDATVSESVSSVASVTQYAIEEGADISDNIRVQSKTFNVSGVVTATPWREEDQYTGRLQDVLNDLLERQAREESLEFLSTLGFYPDVVITSIVATYAGSKAGDILAMEIELQEVVFVEAETVQILQTAVVEKKKAVFKFDPNSADFLALANGRLREQDAEAKKIVAVREKLNKEIFRNPELSTEEKAAAYRELYADPEYKDKVFGTAVVEQPYVPL